MSTSRYTTSTGQFDPGALAAYRGLASSSAGQLRGMITSPYSNPFISRLMTQGQQFQPSFGAPIGAGGAGLGGGMGTAGQNTQLGRLAQFGGLGYGADLNRNLMLGGANWRQQALTSGMMMRPLQTGGEQIQTMQGLGTWLPSVAGLGLSAGLGFMGMGGPQFGQVGSGSPYLPQQGYGAPGAPTDQYGVIGGLGNYQPNPFMAFAGYNQ